jgi:hypothetical protein
VRVAARLLLGTVGILLFAVVVMVWSSRTALRHHLELQLQSDIEEEARLIQAALPDDAATWDRMVGRWAALRAHRVTLFDSTGRALADNQVPPGVLATQSDLATLPEVTAALAGRTGVDVRSDPAEPARIWVAVPASQWSQDRRCWLKRCRRSQRAILQRPARVRPRQRAAVLGARSRALGQTAARARFPRDCRPAFPAPALPRSTS